MPLPYINIHTHHPEADTISLLNVNLTGDSAASISAIPERGFFSAGIHPWDVQKALPSRLNDFDFTHTRLLSIGEVGLDYRPEYEPYDVQRKWFYRQIEIANTLRKPLMIHSVRATDDTLEMLKNHVKMPSILHNFTGSREIAQQWISQIPNLYFSFGSTAIRSPKIQNTIRFIVTEYPSQFFLETDNNNTITIREMYTFVAQLVNWSESDLKSRIVLNFNALFPKNDIK